MLPNLIIIGAMKSATSSLHHYLGRHPDIAMSANKEPQFFSNEESWNRGLDWYRSLFDATAPVRGESSTGYTNYPHKPDVPERMHGIIPDARLIYIVRDPVERMISHYVHFVNRGYEQRGVEAALLDPQGPYLWWSRYAVQLERFLSFYPADRLLVVDHHDLLTDQDATLRTIFRYVGVADDVALDGLDTVKNPSSHKRRHSPAATALINAAGAVKRVVPVAPAINDALKKGVRMLFASRLERPRLSSATRTRIADALRDDVTRFRQLTGRSFDHWSI